MQIEIDFEVFKRLTVERQSETDTYNQVLRRLLKLPSENNGTKNSDSALNAGGAAWVVQGVSFPNGTELRRVYKGKTFLGHVEDGALVVDGKKFASPSMAAVRICGHNVNGWRFWKARLPGESDWRWLDKFRNG